ncbi:MAG: carbohydrate kinase family protein [Actinomycetes bacterium]
MPAHPVVVVGPVMHDVVAVAEHAVAYGSDTPARVSTRGGGAGANVAAWLAGTGTPTVLVARVGADAAGDAEQAGLSGQGVTLRVTRDPGRPTGACVVLVSPDGQRTMLPDQGANAALAPTDVPEGEFRSGRHLHLSGYVLLDPGSREAGLHALALARDAEMTVSVDPASAAPLSTVGAEAFLAWTTGADLLLPNEAETHVLAGTDDTDRALATLAGTYGAVICTRGRRGAVWAAAGHAPVARPADPVPVVDTTGAGDAFAAGTIAAWLTGSGPVDTLAAGCLLAARAVARVGARPSTGHAPRP